VLSGSVDLTTPLQSLLAVGIKHWLASLDPDVLERQCAWGVTGAVCSPRDTLDLLKRNRFDDLMRSCLEQGLDENALAWHLTDVLVGRAQEMLFPVWQASRGDDGYVSFALNPLIEDPQANHTLQDRTQMYVTQGQEWSAGHSNRLIQVPATLAGLAALEELVATGVSVHVTCLFTERQYVAARDAVWRGARSRPSPEAFKSVFGVPVRSIDECLAQHFPELHAQTQGFAGVLYARHIWSLNQHFWESKGLPLRQAIAFTCTETPDSTVSPWKNLESLAGPCIVTNSAETIEQIQASGRTFTRPLDGPQSADGLAHIREGFKSQQLEHELIGDGIRRLVDAQKSLLNLVAFKGEFFRRFGWNPASDPA
jgi:transaldolase